jgi:hypothetical protein
MTKRRQKTKHRAGITLLILHISTSQIFSRTHFDLKKDADIFSLVWGKHINSRNIKIQSVGINGIVSGWSVAYSSASQMEKIVLQNRHATIGETGFCWYLNSTVRLDGQLMLP